jgi:hypothetical protein
MNIKSVIISLCFGSALMVPTALGMPSASVPTYQHPQADASLIGLPVTVYSMINHKMDGVPATDTVESFRDFSIAAGIAHDRCGVELMVQDGRLTVLPPKTYAVVIKTVGIFYQIHVVTGNCTGINLWVMSNDVHRANIK